MKRLQVLILILTSYFCQAQTPVLIKDINPGALPGVYGNYGDVQVGDVIYFIGDINGRRDLYALKNGNVALVLELCPGNCSFFEFPHIEYKGKLYFSKSIGNTSQLWESDGTPIGTKLVLEYNGSFKSFAIGNNSKLYMSMNNRKTYKNEIYLSDGNSEGTKLIGTDISFSANNERFNGAVKYGNGLAFVNIVGDSLKMYKYDDETLSLTVKIKIKPKSSINGFKTIGENDIVMLVHSDESLVSDVYRYDATSNTIKTELTLPFNRQKYPYLKSYTNDSLILYHFEGGHHILTGKPLVKTNITTYNHASFNSIIEPYYHKYKENFTYLAVEDCGELCWKHKFIFCDGNVDNIKEIEIFGADGRGWISNQNYVFFADNYPTGKEGQIQYADIVDRNIKLLYRFKQNFSSGGLKLLGIIDGKIYFLANLDEDFGRELYAIETGIMTSLDDIAMSLENDLKFVQNGKNYTIQTEREFNSLDIRIYDISGRHLLQKKIKPNVDYPLEVVMHGHFIAVVSDVNSSTSRTFQIYIP